MIKYTQQKPPRNKKLYTTFGFAEFLGGDTFEFEGIEIDINTGFSASDRQGFAWEEVQLNNNQTKL